jgi:hypothetical protein
MAYSFKNFNLREVTEADREHCEKWIAADPDHAGRVKSDFFIGESLLTGGTKREPGVERMVLEDKYGQPIFYFRQERALRIHIQFGPSETTADLQRNIDGMAQGMAWLKERAVYAGFRQILFQSKVQALVIFCKRRFGFAESKNELVCGLPPLVVPQQQEKPLHPVQDGK